MPPTVIESPTVRITRSSILAAQPLLDLMNRLQEDLATLQKYSQHGEPAQVLTSTTSQLRQALQAAASLELEIDVTQAAESAGLTPAAIRAHIRSRSLPARRVGKRLYRIRLSDLRAWSEPRQQSARAESLSDE